jgi:hypothetical protein
MKNKKIRKIVRLIVYILLGVFMINAIYAIYSLTNASEEDLPMTQEFPPEYLNLFTPESKNDLKLEISYPSKVRNTISTFEYKKKYSIILYKLDATMNIALNNLISVKRREVKEVENKVSELFKGQISNLNIYLANPNWALIYF